VRTMTKPKLALDEMPEAERVANMVQSGVLYGHTKSKTHPKMRPFIGANRHDVDILDARAVQESLQKAITFLSEVLRTRGSILFVGTTPQTNDLIEALANDLEQPYVTDRWLGGTLTNFDIIRERVEYYQDLRSKHASGELEKYTKKERREFADEIEKLSKHFDGLKRLKELPNAVFIVNIEAHDTALREAQKLDIPIVAIVDSNDNPNEVTYPIIANDHTRSSVEWVLDHVADGLSDIEPTPEKKTKEPNE